MMTLFSLFLDAGNGVAVRGLMGVGVGVVGDYWWQEPLFSF